MKRKPVETYQDNFNLVDGVTKTVEVLKKSGKHQIQKITWRDGEKITDTEWIVETDTRKSRYPSFPAILSAASINTGWKNYQKAWSIFYRLVG